MFYCCFCCSVILVIVQSHIHAVPWNLSLFIRSLAHLASIFMYFIGAMRYHFFWGSKWHWWRWQSQRWFTVFVNNLESECGLGEGQSIHKATKTAAARRSSTMKCWCVCIYIVHSCPIYLSQAIFLPSSARYNATDDDTFLWMEWNGTEWNEWVSERVS